MNMTVAVVSLILIVLVAQCWTSTLLNMDGTPARTELCAGESVTYFCSLNVTAHVWTNGGSSRILRNDNLEDTFIGPNMPPIFIRIVNMTAEKITSSASFNVTSSFNGITLSCQFPLTSVGQQRSMVTVLDPPTISTIDAKGNAGFQSFSVKITGISGVCILRYNLTILQNGRQFDTASINSSGSGIVNIGLNLCSHNYSFVAFGETASDDTQLSQSFQGQVDFSGIARESTVIVTNGMVQWNILSNLPSQCYSNYSLNVSGCMIESFAILPELSLNDDIIRNISTLAMPDMSSPMVSQNTTVYDTVDLGECINATVQTSITINTQSLSSQEVVLFSTNSTSSMPPSGYQCNISVNSGVAESSTSSEFDTCNNKSNDMTTFTDVTTTFIETTTDKPTTPLPTSLIVGVLCGGGFVVLLLVVIIVVLFCIKAKHNKDKPASLNVEPTTGIALQYDVVAHSDDKPDGVATEYDAIIHGNQQRNGDNLPTYQVPESIKRQAAGTGGDIYTLPDKKEGKVKAGKGAQATQEIPMYSMPDKSKKEQNQGLVYADIDVKNRSAAASRSRPPPQPPGFMAQQDSGLVTYSSVQPRNNE